MNCQKEGEQKYKLTLRRFYMRKFSLLAVLAIALAPAQASVIQYALKSDYCIGRCGPSGTLFGTITLTDTVANTVEVNISLNSKYKLVKTGFDVTFAWDLWGNPTVSASGLPAGWSLFNSGKPASIAMSDAGNFEYGLVCCGGKSGASYSLWGPLEFTLTAVGLSTASFSNTNARGYDFAVDVYNTAKYGTGYGNSGLVAATECGRVTISDTPEPATFALLGCGLVGFALILRNRAHGSRRR